ncbi:response regulator transcription factor [Actinotalea sp. M2MS4P-6]|uniref:response regulator transcription factor n=1 Tax=Actinotalea sp. M2MS4P-6 TaxID=2983762 RepID=UPI0021E36D48|nr:response regulator transcription factor [Actinotalea sp. M2MS4P-6]MCV2395506.1 response regulator transcription factor [Actinotalea sp. M2MS4P-6]
MTGVIVCHGSAGVRDRIVAAAHGVPALVPARSAATAEELIALVRRTSPALVLLDAHLPGVGAIEALRRIRGLGADATVIMLAVPGDEITLDRAVSLGARGYLPPDVDRSELAAVAAHGLPTGVPQQTQRSAGGPTLQAVPGRRQPGTSELTRRELEVLAGMSHGRSNAQIGAELFLSEDTVKTHARRLFRKLGAADRAQAVAIGLRTGLIS